MPFRCHCPPHLPCPPAPGGHQLLVVSIDLPIPDISQEGTVRSLAFVSPPLAGAPDAAAPVLAGLSVPAAFGLLSCGSRLSHSIRFSETMERGAELGPAGHVPSLGSSPCPHASAPTARPLPCVQGLWTLSWVTC